MSNSTDSLSHNEGANLQLYLKQVPEGIAGPDDFEVREAPVPEIGDGQVLVRTHYLGVDAALRLIVRDSKDFLFRVEPGDLVRGTVAGEVIESNHPDFAVGEFVLAPGGIQNYIACDGGDLERCDVSQAPLGSWLGGFGVSGLTAYFAITEECKPQPGQTVVVNGAAGAVGSIAGSGVASGFSSILTITEPPPRFSALRFRHALRRKFFPHRKR